MNQKKALKQFHEIEKLKGDMRLAAEEWDSKFQTLIAVILSARSLDETTIRVCENMFKKYPNAKSISKLSVEEVENLVRKINFYRNKAKRVLNCSKVLNENYRGDPPMDFGKLIELPGVGGKTANVFLSEYGGDAIGVDTHVSYISQYLKWTKNNKPERIEEDLKKLFPKRHWRRLNPTLVKFGKKYTSRREKNEVLNGVKKIR
ncbi:endonuclease III [Candidatus Pacearchaeota archaeon]|nr:endonuclease III [Candidatus Pacearchaeota archaeon]|tara:strand:+ start:906 stop:1517 length:612 start_codon:yes stop_codon:yes gene_type:complete